MIKTIGLAFSAILGLLLIYAGFKSPDYLIRRQILILAAPEKIFPYLNNPKLSEQWSPWPEMEPNLQMETTGPAEGVGAKQSWKNGRQLGTGSATITESLPNQRVMIRLEYSEPMVMIQDAEYLIEPQSQGSLVIWQVRGQNNFLFRFVNLFFNSDKMVGGIFEKGLAKLKEVVEKT